MYMLIRRRLASSDMYVLCERGKRMKKEMLAELKPQILLVWKLSLPAILTQITTIAMQYIDSSMVGALGANASASIGLVSSSTWMFGGVTNAVSAGFSVQTSYALGGNREAEARNIIRHGLLTALVLSLLLCLLGTSISNRLPVWLGGDAAICPDASDYFFIYSLMIPFSQLVSISSAFLQCCGDMLTPSILNAAMCVLDVIFNALLIPRFGVAGAGMGTALACAVISLLMLWCCCIHNPQIRLNRREKGSFEPEILLRAFKIGVPVGVQDVAMSGALVAATAIIAPLGATAIAANSFAVTAEALCYMPGYGIGAAAAVLVGRQIGAGEPVIARRYGNISTAMGAILMGITGLLMMLLCPAVFRMLTPVPEVQELAVKVLRLELLAEPLYGISIVAAGALRGAGDTLIPSLMNLGSIWIIRLGLAHFLVPALGLPGMWIAMAIELCCRGLMMRFRQSTSRYYFQKK